MSIKTEDKTTLIFKTMKMERNQSDSPTKIYSYSLREKKSTKPIFSHEESELHD